MTTEIGADMVIGADGLRSRVARILGLEPEHTAPNAACSIYGYWPDVPLDGYHWYYEPGVSIGTIPTTDGDTCVFALIPGSEFADRRQEGVPALHMEALRKVSDELADFCATTDPSSKLRAFAGMPGFLRPATGPGWALVGDAGYFRDPITAHGITDALREAELLSREIVANGDGDLGAYRDARDARVRGLMDVTDRIAAFDWDLEQVQRDHLELNRQMNAQVDVVRELDS